MKYNIGDKVVIVSKRTSRMNRDGLMDKYLGKTMTIKRRTYDNYDYEMEEDSFDKDWGGWSWDNDMINHEATARLWNRTKKSKGKIYSTWELLRDIHKDFNKMKGKTFRYINDSQFSPNSFKEGEEVRISKTMAGYSGLFTNDVSESIIIDNLTGCEEWEEFTEKEETVNFGKAFRALSQKNKTIECILEGKLQNFDGGITDHNFTAEQIMNGEWYIIS